MTRRIGSVMALAVCFLLAGSHAAKADMIKITYTGTDDATQKSLIDDAIKEWLACLVGSPKGQPINLALKFTFKDLGADVGGSTSNIKADANGNPESADIKMNTNADVFYGLGAVPKDKFDALSLIKHEIGHALGFAGGDPTAGLGYKKWNDQITVKDSVATFDKGGLNVTLAGTDANGRSHLDQTKYPNDLMIPVPVMEGQRKGPSDLDFQMLGKAFGYQICPEPSSLAIAGIASLGMLCSGLRGRKRSRAA
jgi:hypothetical protein